MKFAIVCIFALVTIVIARPDDKYTTKYDGIDLDEVLKSDRLFNNYFKCLMDKGKCTPDGNELKRVLPDALKTNCAKCSPKQRDGSDKVIRYMIEKRPAQWEALQTKYDPEHIYIDQYKDAAKERGISL